MDINHFLIHINRGHKCVNDAHDRNYKCGGLMNKLQNFMLGFRGELTRAQIEEHGRVRVERKTKSKV